MPKHVVVLLSLPNDITVNRIYLTSKFHILLFKVSWNEIFSLLACINYNFKGAILYQDGSPEKLCYTRGFNNHHFLVFKKYILLCINTIRFWA
jgi:hypothetical protein